MMARADRAATGTAAGSDPGRPHVGGRRAWLCCLAGVVLLGLVGFLNLSFGAVSLSPAEVWAGLTSESDLFARNVVWQIRYPRVVDGALAGAALGVAGALLQGVTRNPLADPTILGVTAAAGVASAIALLVDPSAPQWALTLYCATGGVAGGLILFVIAWRGSVSPVRLALSGVALSAFLGAVIVGILSSSRTFVQTSLGFLAGGMYGSEWQDLWAALPYVGGGILLALGLAGRLNVLALGDDIAVGLGVMTDRTRLLILTVAGVLTGAAVAIGGLVSFVGLVCPHIARVAVGNDYRLVIPASALMGALLVTGADLFARVVISPSEIPMGIVTAGIGAPFLLYLVKVRG